MRTPLSRFHRTAFCAALALAACALAPRAQAQAVPPPRATTARTGDRELSALWRDVRGALLAGDVVRVARATQFPFQLERASGAPRAVSRGEFPSVLQRLLVRAVVDERGVRVPIRALVARTATLSLCADAPDDCWVGPFHFARTERGWALVGADGSAL